MEFTAANHPTADPPPGTGMTADCKYCAYRTHGHVPADMCPITSVGGADALLLFDQEHPGRCVLVSPWHVRNLFDLSPSQRAEFVHSISVLAEAITHVCGADKVNIAMFGDQSDHLHVHLVPKWRGAADWGGAFTMQPTSVARAEGGPMDGLGWPGIAQGLATWLNAYTPPHPSH